jgi:tetratricopeptide (TPR) repeat protein
VIEADEGRTGEAITRYRAALSAQPNFSDALFNLALILTEQESYIEAAPLWERFIAHSPHGGDTARARRYAALCRFAKTPPQGQPSPTETKKDGGHRIAARQALLW